MVRNKKEESDTIYTFFWFTLTLVPALFFVFFPPSSVLKFASFTYRFSHQTQTPDSLRQWKHSEHSISSFSSLTLSSWRHTLRLRPQTLRSLTVQCARLATILVSQIPLLHHRLHLRHLQPRPLPVLRLLALAVVVVVVLTITTHLLLSLALTAHHRLPPAMVATFIHRLKVEETILLRRRRTQSFLTFRFTTTTLRRNLSCCLDPLGKQVSLTGFHLR